MSEPQSARILVVEDEPLIARELTQRLLDLGYEVPGTAATADEALESARSSRPDLVLLDVGIRGPLDGVETAAALRTDFDVPVIYLTACTDAETLSRAKKTEPYAYLVKPITTLELRSAVELALYKAAADRRVRERELWLETTLRSIVEAVVSTDSEGRITFMNPAAAELTGWSPSDAYQQPSERVLTLIDESTNTPAESPMIRAIREAVRVELPPGTLLRRPSGDERVVENSAAPIIDASGRVLGAVTVFRDVSEQRKLLLHAERNDRLAALGTLAAGIAHEVNNPLSFIIGNQQYALAELAALQARLAELPAVDRDPLEAKVDEISAALADAQVGADRVRRIVSELRKLSQPGTEKRQRIDLRSAVESALSMTLMELAARASVVREYGEAPEVLADETRLVQVFVNLLINAAHAIAPGSAASNEVRAVVGTDTAGHAYVEIRDTGCGIPRSVIPRIFEPFFTTRALETGTGLGLSISHGIVASFGGTMLVESRVGAGSTFRVTLPPAQAPRSVAGTSRSGPRSEGRRRLLIIDDERILLDSLSRALEEGYNVTTVSGGREALALFEAGQRFDLVICDLMMPHMTGMELFRELEARFPDEAARTVFMTGGAFTQKAQQFIGATARRVLEKPFTNTELLAFIAECLTRTHAS